MTQPSRTTRRGILTALACLPLAACAAELGMEPTLPRHRFREVRVDVSPMVRKGVPNWAARVGDAVRAAARREFADLIDPNDRKAPILTLEIAACNFPLWLAGWDKFPLGHFGASDEQDWIEGYVVSGTTRRRVAVDLPSGHAGAWYGKEIDQRRLDAIAAHFAAWARREFGK